LVAIHRRLCAPLGFRYQNKSSPTYIGKDRAQWVMAGQLYTADVLGAASVLLGAAEQACGQGTSGTGSTSRPAESRSRNLNELWSSRFYLLHRTHRGPMGVVVARRQQKGEGKDSSGTLIRFASLVDYPRCSDGCVRAGQQDAHPPAVHRAAGCRVQRYQVATAAKP